MKINHRKCGELRRWKVWKTRNGAEVRLHHWIKGDPEHLQHAHPWPFLTLVLWGGYDDIGGGRPTDYVRGPTWRFRGTDWKHAVVNVRPRTWSIVITGHTVERWRFWIGGRRATDTQWNERHC